MMHSKHLILHDEVGWGRNPSALHAQNRLLFQKQDKTIYILSQISCYPCGAIILRTKAICSKRMRNVFWSCEDEFRKNVLKLCRWGSHSIHLFHVQLKSARERNMSMTCSTVSLYQERRPWLYPAANMRRDFQGMLSVLFSFRPQYPIEEASMVLTVELFIFWYLTQAFDAFPFPFSIGREPTA